MCYWLLLFLHTLALHEFVLCVDEFVTRGRVSSNEKLLQEEMSGDGWVDEWVWTKKYKRQGHSVLYSQQVVLNLPHLPSERRNGEEGICRLRCLPGIGLK